MISRIVLDTVAGQSVKSKHVVFHCLKFASETRNPNYTLKLTVSLEIVKLKEICLAVACQMYNKNIKRVDERGKEDEA